MDTEQPKDEGKEPEESEEGERKENAAVEAESSSLSAKDRATLLREILAKETYVDPLDPEVITKAYSVYDSDPKKIVEALITSFQAHCRKCIRDAAQIRVKNQMAQATTEESERIRNKAIEELSDQVRSDRELERNLALMIFKNQYWNWLRFGLRDIFNEQRKQPGNLINNQLNRRFHKLKTEKEFKTVADLVVYDLTEIINSFKAEITSDRVGVFH